MLVYEWCDPVRKSQPSKTTGKCEIMFDANQKWIFSLEENHIVFLESILDRLLVEQKWARSQLTEEKLREAVIMCNTTEEANSSKEAAAGEARPAPDSNGDSPARKKPKSESIFDATGKSILSKDLLARTQDIHETYNRSQPFPHSQIMNVFRPGFLTACKEEIKSQTKVNFKESDLFRVYQSIDFANLDPERAKAMKLDTSKLTHVMQLRDLLYSQEWRSFVEECAGLEQGTLIDKIDCACNCHAPGCHLLCHDDVIGTRKISYIIYLTEEDWEGPTEGGALELYGPQTDESSTPVPVSLAWPVFNSMAFFEVLPGRSFHAVQEVTGDRPRLSLQGWYHAKDPPPQEEMEKATLQQLKSMKEDEEADTVNEKTDEEDAFTEADRTYLKDYIQNEYLTEESMNEIQTKFENNSTIQFRNFLLQKWVPTIESNYKDENGDGDKKPAASMPSTDDTTKAIDAHYNKGVTSEWTVRGPAHKQRYLTYASASETNDGDTQDNKNAIATGKLLQTVQKQIFESDAFLRYLKRVTSLDKPTRILGGGKDAIRRFRPGLDYTVAHYGLLMQRSVLDATMCFVRDTTEYDQAMWESGDIGGFECYIEADIDDDYEEGMNDGGEETNESAPPRSSSKGAADEYNEEDDTELLSVSASNNTLSLVYRDPGTMRFVKYVSSNAPSSRYDICMEYDLPPDNDEEIDGDSTAIHSDP